MCSEWCLVSPLHFREPETLSVCGVECRVYLKHHTWLWLRSRVCQSNCDYAVIEIFEFGQQKRHTHHTESTCTCKKKNVGRRGMQLLTAWARALAGP